MRDQVAFCVVYWCPIVGFDPCSLTLPLQLIQRALWAIRRCTWTCHVPVIPFGGFSTDAPRTAVRLNLLVYVAQSAFNVLFDH